MLKPLPLLAPMLCAAALAGCGAVGAIGLPLGGRDRQAAAPRDFTMAAPTQPVQQQDLPPLGAAPGSDYDRGPSQDLALNDDASLLGPEGDGAAPAQNAALAANAQDVGRTDLLGGWTVTSGGDTCQLFMTLTAWTGGYRASTRGCSSAALTAISAWNLDGKQVVLSSGEGTPVARLYASGATRFDGQVDAGAQPISFFR